MFGRLQKPETRGQQIYHWTINHASVNGVDFIVFYTAHNPTYHGNSLQQLLIDILHKYSYYKLMCIEAGEGNTGLSSFKLFVY